ncbi:VIT1/CCC1 transporter family protein [Candidatus Woesearchaeota archaeon]|nr:VIT1/CCC1 transporter family protein [Candidatus Woesearchaeota archaeon]
MHKNHHWSENLREVIFGVEDGAIGNLGLVIGMAQALSPNNTILLAGVATMFAQAISMSAGNYLSVKSEKEYFDVKKKSRAYGKGYAEHKSPVRSSIIMALSVILGAAIPLSAFLFWESKQGIIPAVVITLMGLFLLGVSKSKYTDKHWLRSGSEIVMVGFIAAVAGFIIGNLFA